MFKALSSLHLGFSDLKLQGLWLRVWSCFGVFPVGTLSVFWRRLSGFDLVSFGFCTVAPMIQCSCGQWYCSYTCSRSGVGRSRRSGSSGGGCDGGSRVVMVADDKAPRRDDVASQMSEWGPLRCSATTWRGPCERAWPDLT